VLFPSNKPVYDTDKEAIDDREEKRRNTLQEFADFMGKGSLYSNQMKLNTTFDYLRTTYDGSLQAGEQLPDTSFIIAGKLPHEGIVKEVLGRITSRRESSKKLIFYTIESNGQLIQVVSNLKNIEGDQEKGLFINANLRRGDIIGARGHIGKTKTGELSIYTKEIKLLAPCQHNLPSRYGLSQPVRI
jgi:lysyl-tRNA synthetase class II